MENHLTLSMPIRKSKRSFKETIREGLLQIIISAIKSTFPILIETTRTVLGKTMRILAAIALRLLRR